GAIAAHHGRTDRATAAIIGIALLNLFLLLPLVVIAHYVSQAAQSMHAADAAATQPATTHAVEVTMMTLAPLPFPLAVWRVDTVLLIVLGMMLVPVSLGRWPLRRIEGFVLTLLYGAYLIISTTIAIHL